jgi:hypothetical protein
MIRLLTAALLVASFSVVADTKVPNTFTDGTPAKASEVNANFDALETAIDAIPADAVEAVTSEDLDMDGNKVLFSNVYSRLADLPSASDNHGMFAHVHETGEAYFAHAGNWIQIAKQSSVDGASATPFSALTCTTNQIIKYDGTEWVCAAMPADGAKGDTGDKGDKGDTGDKGDKGDTGEKGDTGSPGATGLTGATGSPGAPGADGADGVVNGVACDTDQSIVYRGGAWVCSSPELVSFQFFSSDPFGTAQGTVSCPSGKKVTGGGCEFSGVDGCGGLTSLPNFDLTGWVCEVNRNSQYDYNCYASSGYAICQ